MGLAQLGPRRRSRAGPPAGPREEDRSDIYKLLEENARLRELVVKLIKLALKNMIDPTPRV